MMVFFRMWKNMYRVTHDKDKWSEMTNEKTSDDNYRYSTISILSISNFWYRFIKNSNVCCFILGLGCPLWKTIFSSLSFFHQKMNILVAYRTKTSNYSSNFLCSLTLNRLWDTIFFVPFCCFCLKIDNSGESGPKSIPYFNRFHL